MTGFRVLGLIEINGVNRNLRPKGAMIQTLLAGFLAERDQFVRTDDLVEELWGGAPPAKSDNALQAQVSRLRRVLAQAEPGGAQRLTSNASGYRLSLHWTELDATIFQHKVDSILNQPVTDQRRDTADLRDALSLWRGPVFGGLIGGSICQAATAKYEESRTSALEYLYDLELTADDGHAHVIPELTELVRKHPLRERFCSLLMVALYRSGRQTDALAVYQTLRRRLDEDLGIDPSPVLRRYEQAILNHDPVLLVPWEEGGLRSGDRLPHGRRSVVLTASRPNSLGPDGS